VIRWVRSNLSKWELGMPRIIQANIDRFKLLGQQLPWASPWCEIVVAVLLFYCVIIVAVLLLGTAAQADSEEPFGLPTVVAREGSLWINWQQLQSEIRSDELIIAQCRAQPGICASPVALRFIAIVNEAREYEGFPRIGHLNRAINLAIRAKSSGEMWVSPLAALASEVGDCKSYSVIKYVALNDAGIAADDLRIVIVRIRSRGENHAVVGVRNAGHWLILDNRRMALVESSQLHDYLPLFSFGGGTETKSTFDSPRSVILRISPIIRKGRLPERDAVTR
jgi:predicted transglutaminase-like cysteine proteinase